MSDTELKDIIAYIAKEYPYKDELSNARLTKMVYLADWHYAINQKKQITDIDWFFDNHGPYVPDVLDAAKENTDFLSVDETENMYGSKKVLISFKRPTYSPSLSDKVIESINHIISVTKDKNWNEFIKLVYSTYPVLSSAKYSHLNLIEKAKEYTKEYPA